jgi:MSHA biogenesis protein MshJ
MKRLLQRWQALAPREQWLAVAVATVLLILLYGSLVSDPLAANRAQLANAQQSAQARLQAAVDALDRLAARRAADPNLTYRSALQVADSERAGLLDGIDHDTAGLIRPQQMRQLLQDLLLRKTSLRLVSLQSYSAPLQLPGQAAGKDKQAAAAPAPVAFYRHGVRLTLEGGYLDLLAYLEAVQASGWRLHWQSLDYQVGDAGPAHASIVLDLYTLSRDAGWLGV